MNPIVLRVNHVVFWTTLTLWLGVLLSAGIAAMNTFPTLQTMNITLHDYAAFQPERSDTVSVHGLLAAGMVMEGVFFLINMAQFIVAPLTLITLVVSLVAVASSWKRPLNLARLIAVTVACLLFAWHGLIQFPRMNRELHDYWSAAKMGLVEKALGHQRAFERDHPLAENVLQINMILLLFTIGVSAAVTTPLAERKRGSLQSPALLKR